jgi:hypothetical protein
MPGTALDHPLVRSYLRELDAALAVLPARRAGELREQITAHLWDELGSEPGDDVAAAVLRRLGPPRELAAEAGAGETAAREAAARAAWLRRPVRTTLARLSWRTWLSLAATVIAAITVTGYLVAVHATGALQAAGQEGWWYPQDVKSAVYTSADLLTQSTVPIRPGQRQGLYADVYNPSDWSQTVIAFDPHWELNPGGTFGKLTVATTGGPYDEGTYTRQHYRLPGIIPPHQWRMVRLMWANAPCLPSAGEEIFDELILTVRVGGLDRTETLPLQQAYAVSSPGPSTCHVP